MEQKPNNTTQNKQRSFFNLMLDVFAWLQIVASPFLISLVIAVVIYIAKTDNTGFIIAICVASLGLLIGIIWATRIWKKKGTFNYISKVRESPEYDNLNDKD